MSSLFANQLRKELRQHAGLIFPCIGLLVLEFLRAAGVTETLFDPHGNYQLSHGLSPVAFLAIALIGVFLPVAVGLGDSPSNSERFIATRPISAKTVWGAKVSLLVLFIAVPAALVPLALSLVHGAGLVHGLRAAIDRLAFLLPVLVFFLCWAGLSGSRRKFTTMTIAGAAAIGLTSVTIALVELIDPSAGRNAGFYEPGSVVSRILVVFWAVMACSLFTLSRELFGRRKKWRLPALVVAIGLIVFVVFTTPGLNFLRSDSELASSRTDAFSELQVVPDPYTLSTSWGQAKEGGDDGGREFNLQSKFKLQGLPDGYVVQPSVRRVTLSGEGGAVAEFEATAARMRRIGSLDANPSIVKALATKLDRDITIHVSSEFGGGIGSTVSRWEPGAVDGEQLRQPLDVEWELDLACGIVEPIQILPLKDGASVEVDGVKLTLRMPELGLPRARSFALQARLPKLALTRDASKRLQDSWRQRIDYVCLLTHPERREALLCANSSPVSNRGKFSGLPERIWIVQHRRERYGELFDEEFFDGAELRLFRVRYLGVRSATARADGLRLDHRMREAFNPYGRVQLDVTGYRRALESLGGIPESPTSWDVQAVMRIIDRSDRWPDAQLGEPGFDRLLGIGRRDLNVLVSEVGESGSQSQRSLIAAIDLLADLDDKGLIIANLQRAPALAEIVVSRGWERDAGDELMALLRERRALPMPALQAIVLLENPEANPLLLEQFSHTFRPTLYDLLWQVPEVRPELVRLINERWITSLRSTRDQGGDVFRSEESQLALRTGNFEALDGVLRAFGTNEPSVVRTLRPVMLLPQRWEAVRAELAEASASDFTFDEELRLFRRRQP